VDVAPFPAPSPAAPSDISASIKGRAGIDRPVFTKKGALRKAFRTLRGGGMVALLNDQDSRGSGVFVPYFGRLAKTHEGAATLALTTGLPVYVLFCIRTAPRSFTFRIHCRGPLEYAHAEDHAGNVYALTAAMNVQLEDMARRHPEQIMWAHRRWKSRPPGEA
jgi:KDO2-lipid IV(A) lauroyltransferase